MGLKFIIARDDPTKTAIEILHYSDLLDPVAYTHSLEAAAGRTYEQVWGDVRAHLDGIGRGPIDDPYTP